LLVALGAAVGCTPNTPREGVENQLVRLVSACGWFPACDSGSGHLADRIGEISGFPGSVPS
jgi:hypothetical protein